MPRKYGAGTVYPQMRSGRPTGRYVGQASLGRDETGERLRISVTADSEAAAWKALNDARRIPMRSTRRRGGETVAAFLGRWLADVVKPTKRERTWVGYRQIVTDHLVPAFGDELVTTLTRRQVQAWVNRQTVAPMTTRHLLDCLRGALSYAVRWGIRDDNPATMIDLPPVTRHVVRAMSNDTARGVIAATADQTFGNAVAVALYTGLRQGELLGLRWEDIDLKGKRLTVHHALSRLPGSRKGTIRYVLNPPKSERSVRTVPLAPAALDALTAQRKAQAKGEAGKHGLVFAHPDGRPLDGPTLTRDFQVALKAAGIEPMRWHDLRHGTASLLIAAGTPLAVVSAILGHSGIAITVDTYGHLTDESKASALDHMAAQMADTA